MRLVVEGKDGNTVEDRVTVEVGDVIPNAWGGVVRSTDKNVFLTVPEQALMDSFRLMSIKPLENTPKLLPEKRKLIGRVYEFREPGEKFTKETTLEMKLAASDVGETSMDQLGIYAYNSDKKRWEHLESRRRGDNSTIFVKVRTLQRYYALIASDLPGEGSALEFVPNNTVHVQIVSENGAHGPYLVKDTFEDGAGEWSNRDGEVGATVTLDDTATFDGTRCLKVTDTNGGGNFAVNVRTTPFNAREYPVVQFDYRILPDVKADFLIKVSGRWYEIGFTDDYKELRDRRVNIAHIGSIEGVVADDQWHAVRFDLYDMLRTKTRNTVVEEMIMADWDVGGYMKLQFGHNRKGATYYIDNFTISREVSAGLRINDDTILVDHFNQKKASNALGGATTTFVDSIGGSVQTAFSNEDAVGKGHALALSYDVSQVGSYAGYISALQNLDLRSYHALTFFVKGSEPGQDLLVGLKDRSGHERKVRVSTYLPKKLTTAWRQVTIPLTAFSPELDWGGIDSLSLSFEHALHPVGTVFVDAIAFHRDLQSVLVENFESADERNFLGGKHWTFASGAAAAIGCPTAAISVRSKPTPATCSPTPGGPPS